MIDKRKILVVDDEPYIIKSLSFVLTKEGFNVLSASDGEEAISKVKSFNPEILLLDVMMPKKNGYEVCREIRKDKVFDNLYIILLTAKGQDDDKAMGLNSGANEYLTKPFSPLAVVKKIKEVCAVI